MATMHLGTLSPVEDENKPPVGTVTPSLTPTSSPKEDAVAGKKLYSLEHPDDRAKELASQLTLEEQVRVLAV
jgi:beta-glucosidase